MRIDRTRSRHIFRQKSRWSGCLSWMTTLSVLLLIVFVGRQTWQLWWLQWLSAPDASLSITDVQVAYRAGDLDSTITMAQTIYGADNTNIQALETLVRALIYRSYADLNQESDRELALSLTTSSVERTPYDMQVLGIHAFALQANAQSADAQQVVGHHYG
ncbi:MAG: hypothetical protein AAFV93_13360 [Chloroflexota bacterium]